MAEFVAQLGEGQRHGKGGGTAKAEQVRKGGDKTLPVARHQQPTEQQHQRHANAQQVRADALQQRPGAVEKGVRAPQRYAEKQVLVQQRLP